MIRLISVGVLVGVLGVVGPVWAQDAPEPPAEEVVVLAPAESAVIAEVAALPPGIDYLCRGTDKRILGKVGAVLQQGLSWPFRHLHNPPKSIKVGNQMVALPPFVAINIPYWAGHWATIRVGWRYDVNCRRYIADVILKMNEETPLFY